MAVGFLSAVAGSAGPLGAAVFLGLHLPAGAYVASEAVTAVLMHLTKSLVYGRYAALSGGDLLRGLRLGQLAGARFVDGPEVDTPAAGKRICFAGGSAAGRVSDLAHRCRTLDGMSHPTSRCQATRETASQACNQWWW